MASTLGEHPYADLLAGIEKPARYIGGEHNEIVKDPGAVAGRLVLAFPDVYEIGSSHLGTKIIYSLINGEPDLACERAFTPWPDMEAALRERGIPLVSLETATALREFDVVGISLQYELTYTNALTLLDLGGIPLRAAHRGDDDPLVLGGGPTATHPEPLAPFFDAFFIGEAEGLLPGLIRSWASWRRDGVPRRERLLRLAELGYIYVPSLYATAVAPDTGFQVVEQPLDPRVPARPRRAWVENLDVYPFPSDSPVPHAEAIFDRQAVEIARGCTEGCRFCQAGMIYRPVRERSPEAVVDAVVGGIQAGGYDSTALTSLSTADYSAIHPLLRRVIEEISERKVSLSVSSLRAYGLPEDLLDGMRTVRANGLTFAPEAGTQRMRDVICKNVTDEHLLETARQVFSRGWERMKLYFMVGLPTEEEEDVRGIIETARKTREEGLKVRTRNRLEVTASVSSHIPKPHTPFQWCAQDTVAQMEEKQRLLASEARKAKVFFRGHDARASWLEGIFSRGDRRVGEALEHAWRNGCRFDGWDEHLKMDVWEQAFTACDLDVERYLGTIPVDARLPWDHIDVGLEEKFLKTEYRRALRNRTSPPCGKVFGRLLHHTSVEDALADKGKLICYDCGVACDMAQMRTERIQFLDQLGAREPAPLTVLAVEAPVTGGLLPPARKGNGRRQRPQPPVAFDGVHLPSFRYRVLYEKRGVGALSGHLDLVRLVARMVRRAGLMPSYSRGFHPRPRFSFGPALGLGVESAGEVADLTLVNDLPAALVAQRLADASGDGITVLRAVRAQQADPGLGTVVRWADFEARLATPVPLDCAALLARDELLVERASGQGRQRKLKELDVRRYLVSVTQPEPRIVRWRVSCGPEGSARPQEVLTALFQASGLSELRRPTARFERLALWARTLAGLAVSALELHALRPPAVEVPLPGASEARRAVP